MIAPKKCPFCGGSNLATPFGVATVVCGDCGAAGPSGTPHPRSDALTNAAAYSKWNAERPCERALADIAAVEPIDETPAQTLTRVRKIAEEALNPKEPT